MAFADKLLRIDLSARTVESEQIPESWLRRFVGGKGLSARYLYDELAPGTDPLASENALLFMCGPLTGKTPGESRFSVVTKSPLTGTFLDSYIGGTFPESLAGALSNHLGMLVTGSASAPVTIRIADGDATIESAGELWGKTVPKTCSHFDSPTSCIGPAGERLVRYATIASDGGDHHAARGGSGAVMGSKNLKAVVAEKSESGEETDESEDDDRYRSTDIGKWQAASETVETIDFANEVGVLPTKGWQESSFEGADELGIEAVRKSAVGREHPEEDVSGGFRIESEEGETVPRGATSISLGAGLGIDDFDAVAVLGALCDILGLDLISAGNTVAWTMRAAEEGLLERDIEFGDDESARALLEEIVHRSSPLGDTLANGIDAATNRYGGEELIPTVKGMDLPTYDPRRSPSMALAYATSDRGACHRRARPVLEEVFATEEWSDDRRAEAVIAEQNLRSFLWCLVVDDFAGEALWKSGVESEDGGNEWLREIGFEHSRDELLRIGERVWTMTRLFNVREGFSRAEDSLPVALQQPLRGDERDGERLVFESFARLLSAYYEKRDWDEQGRPTDSLLSRLGLDDVVDQQTPTGDD
ncbi:aldehyde ferredoxin oxidoreductase family protein [Haladaptatus litoreus]|nr:aldehyde ferredoxin oxidoreductase C-terminal domain-containing protein [Haladaptatus litoreus]